MAAQAQMFGFTPSSVKPADEQQAEISRLKMELHKAQKQAAQAGSDRRAMMQQNQELNSRLSSQADLISGMLEKLREYEREKQTAGSIPADMWRRLVQLCHPDRHGNSEAANNATQWLNKVRP